MDMANELPLVAMSFTIGLILGPVIIFISRFYMIYCLLQERMKTWENILEVNPITPLSLN